MYSCVFPCIPTYSLVFPCIPMYSHVFPCIPTYSLVFLRIPLYSYIFPCFLLYSLVFLCIPLYSHIFPCIPTYSYVFPCFLLYSLVFLCIPKYSYDVFLWCIPKYFIVLLDQVKVGHYRGRLQAISKQTARTSCTTCNPKYSLVFLCIFLSISMLNISICLNISIYSHVFPCIPK